MGYSQTILLCCLVALVFIPSVTAFGAGNIASVSSIEGHNWRHGDIEDLLTTVAFIKGHKWSSMNVKRVYFGNWLRDYSQAVDVGTLGKVQADTIRILVWVLGFMSFGYATQEFEVTAERLGTYRPEEHIDNPKDYADNQDARKFDPRLRGPIQPIELAVDPNTGMKNYIANESGGWATSLGYIKYSFARSIHFGRLYTHGANKGREEDLCEALRCLGQGLHCVEDFGAHTNYVELALIELGHRNVFPHVGSRTMLNLRGNQVYPLTTGTFGGVDFLHSVIGEANDHVTQTEVNESEVNQLNTALSNAAGKRGFGDPASNASSFTSVLANIPGTDGLVREAIDLQAVSDRQAAENERVEQQGGYQPYGGDYSTSRAGNDSNTSGFSAPPGSQGGPPGPGIPGTNINPQEAMAKIYPILVFRDKVVRSISAIISKIPGLEKMIETITEKVTLFVLGLLAPFIKPIIATASNALKTGSGTVVDASAKQQYLVWEDPNSSDPTHSMLSKDHFSNILNSPAGQLAGVMLKYVAPRVVWCWDHPEANLDDVLHDVGRVFHHPALRDRNCELHRDMFAVVERFARESRENLDHLLSSESVRAGKNHKVQNLGGSFQPLAQTVQSALGGGTTSHSHTAGGVFQMLNRRELDLSEEGSSAGPSSSTGGYGYQQQQGYDSDLAYGQPPPSHGQYGSSGYGQQAQQPQYQGGYEQQQQGGYPPQGGYGGGYGGGGYGGGYGEQQQPPPQQHPHGNPGFPGYDRYQG